MKQFSLFILSFIILSSCEVGVSLPKEENKTYTIDAVYSFQNEEGGYIQLTLNVDGKAIIEVLPPFNEPFGYHDEEENTYIIDFSNIDKYVEKTTYSIAGENIYINRTYFLKMAVDESEITDEEFWYMYMNTYYFSDKEINICGNILKKK